MFDRTLKLIDQNLLKKIGLQKVLLVGIGGVGSFVLESLIRSGFLDITLIDSDSIEKSNLNRQIISTKTNLGKLKIEEAKKRGLSINPQVQIKTFPIFLEKDNFNLIIDQQYDYIIDACDTITTKILLIEYALKNNIKIISCMGTANRLDPRKLEITRLDKTQNDPLAKSVRHLLKKRNLSLKIPVIWSQEIPIKNKELGSMIMVPATAGILITYYLINEIKKATTT